GRPGHLPQLVPDLPHELGRGGPLLGGRRRRRNVGRLEGQGAVALHLALTLHSALALAVHGSCSGSCRRSCCTTGSEQGRRDSSPQPPVLETGALPVELLPSAGSHWPS